jgi:hypothetical protein
MLGGSGRLGARYVETLRVHVASQHRHMQQHNIDSRIHATGLLSASARVSRSACVYDNTMSLNTHAHVITRTAGLSGDLLRTGTPASYTDAVTHDNNLRAL